MGLAAIVEQGVHGIARGIEGFVLGEKARGDIKQFINDGSINRRRITEFSPANSSQTYDPTQLDSGTILQVKAIAESNEALRGVREIFICAAEKRPDGETVIYGVDRTTIELDYANKGELVVSDTTMIPAGELKLDGKIKSKRQRATYRVEEIAIFEGNSTNNSTGTHS